MTYTNECPKCGGRNIKKKVIARGFLGRLNRWFWIVLTLGYSMQFDHLFTEYECEDCGLKYTI